MHYSVQHDLQYIRIACPSYRDLHGATDNAFAPIGTSSPETMELLIENIRFMKQCWGEETK